MPSQLTLLGRGSVSTPGPKLDLLPLPFSSALRLATGDTHRSTELDAGLDVARLLPSELLMRMPGECCEGDAVIGILNSADSGCRAFGIAIEDDMLEWVR